MKRYDLTELKRCIYNDNIWCDNEVCYSTCYVYPKQRLSSLYGQVVQSTEPIENHQISIDEVLNEKTKRK